jgi:N-acetyl-anhydromuramyl-L-alanine amidase AmpD
MRIQFRKTFSTGLRLAALPLMALALALAAGCKTTPAPGAQLKRSGDEIMVAGQLFHTGTPVVLWTDPGGYDAYRVERRFSPLKESSWDISKEKVKNLGSPNRYGLRRSVLSDEEAERVRGGGWDLPLLQDKVDQFVIHYDVAGTSKQCFKILHDLRALSVHFMLDLDGTIYQTLDLKERAWHASSANSRSIGIEIANMGAYPLNQTNALAEWYRPAVDGKPVIRIPERFGDPDFKKPNFVGRPARPEPVAGMTQGQELLQYDFTPEQYAALARLTATLCTVFPKLLCDYPKDAQGNLITEKLPDAELSSYNGLLGHFHVQTNKTDPGPAFQWEKLVRESKAVMKRSRSREQAPGHGRFKENL